MTMTCDVCSQQADTKQGYILSTSQVVYDPGYWKRSLKLLPLSAEQAERGLPALIRQMAGSQSDWILCEECMGFLNADRSKSARYYQDYVKSGKRPSLSNSGPANADRTAMVASGAFETMFGRKPKTILVQGAPGRVVSAREFSNLMAAALSSGDRKQLAEIGVLQVQCEACRAVMPVIECQLTSSGMACPRCAVQWFLVK